MHHVIHSLWPISTSSSSLRHNIDRLMSRQSSLRTTKVQQSLIHDQSFLKSTHAYIQLYNLLLIFFRHIILLSNNYTIIFFSNLLSNSIYIISILYYYSFHIIIYIISFKIIFYFHIFWNINYDFAISSLNIYSAIYMKYSL